MTALDFAYMLLHHMTVNIWLIRAIAWFEMTDQQSMRVEKFAAVAWDVRFLVGFGLQMMPTFVLGEKYAIT